MNRICRRGRIRRLSWVKVVLAVGIAGSVALGNQARVRAEGPAAPRGRELPENSTVRLGAEAGFGQLEEDFYVDVAAMLDWRMPVPQIGCEASGGAPGDNDGTTTASSGESDCGTLLQIGLQTPIRLRLVDRPPADSGVLRNEDWDEVGDYLKVVRFVEYGRPDEKVHGRIGELGAVSVGHGTIVNHYYNVVTPDHFRLGVHSNVNTVYGGGTLLVSDFVDPNVVGGRGYVRPWSFVDPGAWGHRLAVGATLMMDPDAPVRLSRSAGAPVVGPTRQPEVDRARATALGGVDVELAVVDSEVATLLPYADLNHHFGLGSGFHGGVAGSLNALDTLELEAKLEYRSLGPRYLPDYFGSLYEIDRYQYSGWGLNLPQPQLQLAAEPRDGSTSGGYGEVGASLEGVFDASFGYAEYEGPDNGSFRLAAHLTPGDRFRLGLFFFEHGLDGPVEVFDAREAFIVAESRVGIVGPLYGKAAFSRLWQLRDDGNYEVINRWNLGVGASITL